MLHVVCTTYDASGAVRSREAMPLLFPDRAVAALFVESHLADNFGDGKSGYDDDAGSWWGCDDTPELTIRRFKIETFPPKERVPPIDTNPFRPANTSVVIHPTYDQEFYLARSRRYLVAAELEPDAGLRATLEAVARAYMAKAQELIGRG